MSQDMTNAKEKLTNKEFKKVIETVEKYKSQGGEDGHGNINANRNVFIYYPNTEKFIKYSRYLEMKGRWDNFINKNGREPSYIWINTNNANITTKSPVGVKFSKEVINNTAKTIQNSIKKGDGVPSSLNVVGMDNLTYNLSKSQLAGLFESRNVFILKNGRHPNYVVLNSTASNPTVLDYQNNKYNCCPTSLSMCIQFLYGFVSESVCASVLGTNTAGTSPQKLLTNGEKLGYGVSIIPRTYEAVRLALERGFGVIAHIETAGKTKPSCLGFTYNYGHYVHINKAEDGKFVVLDPTKGKKTCTASAVINATNGRSINFYCVKPL